MSCVQAILQGTLITDGDLDSFKDSFLPQVQVHIVKIFSWVAITLDAHCSVSYCLRLFCSFQFAT